MTSTIFTFPLEPLGTLLRDMSLSGTAGNVTAIILYGAISLLPVLAWLLLKMKKRETKADYMLFLLSGTLFYVLYYSVNPGLFKTNLPGTAGLYLSGILYAVLVTYGVIRIRSMAAKGTRQTLFSLMSLFLVILAVVFAVMTILEFAVTLPDALKKTQETYDQFAAFAGFAEMEVTVKLEVMSAITVMESIMRAVPYILDIIIIIWIYRMIQELKKDWFSERSVKAAKQLAEGTGRVLIIVAVLELLYNVLHFFGRNHVAISNFSIHIPILSILFMLAVLLIAQYIRASHEIKEENEMFI